MSCRSRPAAAQKLGDGRQGESYTHSFRSCHRVHKQYAIRETENLFWTGSIVPFAVELLPLDAQRAHLLGGDLDAGGVAAAVELGADDESPSMRRLADEVDDRLVGAQRPAAPVDGDEREEPMLDLVPLARAGREVAHPDREAQLVGEALKLQLPASRPSAVAPASIGGDEDL